MIKNVTFSTEAREKIRRGIDTVADAVRGTLGPKGKAVLIDKGIPVFTLDGVTVANAIEDLKGKEENMGAKLVKTVAQKTNDEAGDGTTTAAILVQELIKEGTKGIETGLDPIKMRKAWEDGSRAVLEALKTESKAVKGKEDLKNIAAISSRDPEIGKIISEIYEKTGPDGVITTEEVKVPEMSYEVVEGMELDRGYISPYFMTNPERQTAILENPKILVTSQHIQFNADLIGILEAILTTSNRSIVIIADDVSGEALATVTVNKLQGRIKSVIIKAPGFGETRKAHAEDICALTGATYVTEEAGKRMEDVKLEDLGEAQRVIVYKDKTHIVGGKGSKKIISARIEMLSKQIKDEKADYKKTILKKRHARLKGGVAIIRVGAATEEESKEKQYRVEDAVNAARSAMEEGIVIGGGLALFKASVALNEAIRTCEDQDYRFGLQALQRAIQRPSKQVLENAGQNSEVILEQISRVGKIKGNENMGFNAADGITYRDFYEIGIVDPLKVERVALGQAVSIAGLYLITNAVVADAPKDDQEKRPAELNR